MTTKHSAAASGSHEHAPARKRVSAKAVRKQHKQDSLALGESADETQVHGDGVQDDGQDDGGETTALPNTIDGIRLIRLIKKTLIDRGLPDRTISDLIVVSPVYWKSIMNGSRSIKSLPKFKLAKVADWLGLPTVQVYIYADIFTAEDFGVKANLDQQLWLGVKKMEDDPTWSAYAPTREEWDAMPLKLKLAFVTLYEREYGKALFERAKIEVPKLTKPPKAS